MATLLSVLLSLIISVTNASFWSLDIRTVNDWETGLSLNTLICFTFGLLGLLILINIGCLKLIYCFAKNSNALMVPINAGSDPYDSD